MEDFGLLKEKLSISEAVLGVAKENLRRTAITYLGRKISYKKLYKKVIDLSLAFYSMGLKKGDVVLVVLPNIPQAVYVLYAFNRIGAIPAFVSPLSAEYELEEYIKKCKTKVIIAFESLYEKFIGIFNRTGLKKLVLTSTFDEIGFNITRKKENAVLWSELFKLRSKANVFLNSSKAEDTAVILFSGGTTGKPKAVELTNLNLNALATGTESACCEEVRGVKMLSVLPVFHGFGLGICVHTVLYFGGECILVPRFESENAGRIIKRQKPQYLAVVPAMLSPLMNSKAMAKADLSGLSGVFSGGDSLSAELQETFNNFLLKHNASVRIRQGYGLTECVASSCLMPADSSRLESIGNPYPNTMYKIEVSIEGFHELIGQTSDIFTTDATTNIVSFTSIAGAEDGSVVLNFTVDGEEPPNWAVRYSTDGEDEKRETFEGHTVSISGLTIGKIYTFTLDAGNELSLSGKTALDFMSSRLILAENLTVTTTNGTDMTIRWTTPGDTVVESWNVRCYNDFGYDETLTVTDTEVYLSGIDSSVGYNVEVMAYGMTQPARTSITANPLNITGLNVDASEMDKLTVSWEYAGNEPEGGWLLMYNIDGNSNFNVIKCDKPTAVITPKIPDADYQFTIQSVDGTSIFGNVHSYTCPMVDSFDDYALTPEQIKMNTIKTPDEKNWKFDNIGSKAFTDQFAVGDGISLILQAQSNFYLYDSKLYILYVLRDAHGNVIPDSVTEEQARWKQIWYGGDYHYAELDIPNLPQRAGTYTLELYFDGTAVGNVTFTIHE